MELEGRDRDRPRPTAYQEAGDRQGLAQLRLVKTGAHDIEPRQHSESCSLDVRQQVQTEAALAGDDAVDFARTEERDQKFTGTVQAVRHATIPLVSHPRLRGPPGHGGSSNPLSNEIRILVATTRNDLGSAHRCGAGTKKRAQNPAPVSSTVHDDQASAETASELAPSTSFQVLVFENGRHSSIDTV